MGGFGEKGTGQPLATEAVNKKPRRMTKGEHLYAHALGNLSLEFLEKINLIKLETHPHSVEKMKLIFKPGLRHE